MPAASGNQPSGPTITAIMPVYNAAGFLRQSLRPLCSMAERGELLEVIVAEDGSSDDSARIARELGAELIPTEGRQGPGAARNLAAKSARGEVLWFVDADVIVPADAAKIIREAFTEPAVVAAFGSYDDHPPATNFLSQYKNLVHHYYHQRAQGEASTFWAGCGAVRKPAFEAVDGFDTQRFQRPSIEDIELGYRLHDHGGRIRLLPDLQATHLKVWRLGNLLHTEIFCRAMPWTRLMLERGGLTDDLNVSMAERVRALLAILWASTLIGLALGALAWWAPVGGLGVVALANRKLTGLFARRHGWLFALGGLVFHQVYYLYSSAAFAIVLIRYRMSQLGALAGSGARESKP